MTTKLIILTIFGFLVLGLIVALILRAVFYHRKHPNETYWPYYGLLNGKRRTENH